MCVCVFRVQIDKEVEPQVSKAYSEYSILGPVAP